MNSSKSATAFSRSYETVDRDGKAIIPIQQVEIVPSDSTTAPKHVYVNISTINNNETAGIPAQFQIDFDQPFLRNSEKYQLTIAKARFPTISIPLFQFKTALELFSTGPDVYVPTLSQYQIQLSDDNVSYIVDLHPINIIQSADSFYYVFSYQQFLDSMNVALMQAFCQLLVDNVQTPISSAPFITYDSRSQKFKLISQLGEYTPENLVNAPTISFNYLTAKLFSFPTTGVVLGDVSYLQVINETQSGLNVTSTAEAINPLLQGTMTNMAGGLYPDWNATFRYTAGALTVYAGNYYGSLQQNNFNRIPSSAPTYWQLICSTALNSGTGATVYDSTASYVKYQLIYYPTANSVPYVSLVSANMGNQPDTSIGQWLPLPGTGSPTVWNQSGSYAIGQNVYYPSGQSTIYTNITGTNDAKTVPSSDLTNWQANGVVLSNIVIGEYSTLPQWSDIESIVIQSLTIPIRYEVFAPPNSDNITSGSQVPRPVLTDLDPVTSIDGFDRTPLQYVPPGPYRMIDLLAREQLTRIDALIQYKHKDLTFTDLILLPGDYFSIKYLFIRQDALSVT